MASRLELQTVLEDVLGSRNVYYQPPESIRMKYPAIVYVRSKIKNVVADDSVYFQKRLYDVTVVDKDPDSEIVDKISLLPGSSFDRHYTADNLNHDVFTLYF